MTLAVESWRTELASLVGESRLVTEPEACAALAADGKVPNCVVYPPTAKQVAAVLRYAAEHDLAIIPCRNGTKLSTGNPPRRYDLALSLKDLNHVWHYEPADLTISVEPGMKLGDFQHFVGRDRLWLPLDPRGGVRASIGGIIAANAAGPLRQGFGGPRDMVLGLKIATTDGKIVKTGGRVVKNVAGYDLIKLLIGSYGTLGVIVEANFKLYPKPAERVTFTVRVGTLAIARELRRSILSSPLDALRLVLLDSTAIVLTRGTAKANEQKDAEVWVEVGGSRRVIERCERDLGQLGRGIGAPLGRLEVREAEAAWDHISNLSAWLEGVYPDVIVLKAALPIAAGEEFLSHAQQQAEGERIPAASFAQVGVGIVHFCLLQEKLIPGLEGLISRTRKAAVDLGGTLLIEHCPTQLKGRLDVWGTPGDDFEAMHKMKSAWDPKGILVPGRFVGGL
ncbi:MAG: FAD-binding oxidoreductase [Acidobacteriia bacterium]|nr:FAD-binding oxidoreductase [Terriglobia bacterium]